MIRRLLTRFLRRQEGVALPVVLGSLTVVTGLAAGTFMVTVEGNHASARDRDSKRALAAAEAGLQMASLRITELRPNVSQCVTSAAVPVDPSTGECPYHEESIGNGARYRYVVSTPTSGTCPTIPGFTPTPGLDRCITSTGEVNGVKRRLQLRFYFRPPYLPWGNAGLVGKNKVDIGLNKTINSPVGTNGQVLLANNSTVVGELLLPHGAPHPDMGQHAEVTANPDIKVPRVAPWEFPEIDWETPRLDNDNDALAGAAGTPAWDGKYLRLAQQQSITLAGGTYYMCGLDAPNGNTLNVPEGQFVRIYIDSARNPESDCDENVDIDGKFAIKNSGIFNPLPVSDPKAEQLAVFVYGTTEDNTDADPPDVNLNNGVSFWGTIWAPNSTISVWNNQTVSGGFTAGTISLKNNGGFSYDSDIANQALPGTASARNLSWFECRRDPTVADDPESGCS